MKIFSFILFLIITSIIFSCAVPKNIIYLQDAEKYNGDLAIGDFEPKLQPDDKLSIIVSAENAELTQPFNMPELQVNYNDSKSIGNIKTYLIDNAGYIDYPIIGKVKMAGLTKSEANNRIVENISPYFKTKPTVNLEILNFKVSVLGEVRSPGTIQTSSDRMTLLEAIAKAGDLTILGKREDILLIRDFNGHKTFHRIDLTNTKFINSHFYYLKQNDVLIVEPNKKAVRISENTINAGIVFSGLSLLLTVFIVFFKK